MWGIPYWHSALGSEANERPSQHSSSRLYKEVRPTGNVASNWAAVRECRHGVATPAASGQHAFWPEHMALISLPTPTMHLATQESWTQDPPPPARLGTSWRQRRCTNCMMAVSSPPWRPQESHRPFVLLIRAPVSPSQAEKEVWPASAFTHKKMKAM